jgi:hypothetical protein
MSYQQPQPMSDQDARAVDVHLERSSGIRARGAPPAPGSLLGVPVPPPPDEPQPDKARVLR